MSGEHNNQEPLMENQAGAQGIDENIQKARDMLSKQHLPTINFCLSIIMIFAVFVVSQLANKADMGLFSFGGSFLFLMFMFFSILGMYGGDQNQKWALTVYKNGSAIYCIGFIAMFVVSIVALASKNYDNFSESTAIIFCIISLPYAIWMGITFYFVHKQMGAPSSSPQE